MSRRRNKCREETEDALKYLHKCEYEGGGRQATAESLAGAIGCTRDHAVQVMRRLEESGLCQPAGGGLELSERGREKARHIIRAHRLYETYLARKTGTPPAEWHEKAERAEHSLEDELADRLAHSLGHPRFDPHGDPIPTKAGDLPELRGQSLVEREVPCWVRVLHVGDEPESLGRRLAALGIAPGVCLRVFQRRPSGLAVSLEGREIVISLAEGALIRVEPMPEAWRDEQEDVVPLSRLREGEAAMIRALSPACRGAERARLLDLGFVRGSQVEAVMASPLGSPTAYRVRDSLVALRQSQADFVLVQPLARQPPV